MTFITFEIKDTEKGCNLFKKDKEGYQSVHYHCRQKKKKIRISTKIVERKGREDWGKRSIGCYEG